MELVYLMIIRNAVFVVGMICLKLMQVKARMAEFIFIFLFKHLEHIVYTRNMATANNINILSVKVVNVNI